MAKFASLIVGQTYDVMGIRFTANNPIEVDEALADYLEDNEQFEITSGKAPSKEKAKGKGKDAAKAEVKADADADEELARLQAIAATLELETEGLSVDEIKALIEKAENE
jgi:hypothetical protein